MQESISPGSSRSSFVVRSEALELWALQLGVLVAELGLVAALVVEAAIVLVHVARAEDVPALARRRARGEKLWALEMHMHMHKRAAVAAKRGESARDLLVENEEDEQEDREAVVARVPNQRPATKKESARACPA